MRVHLEEMYCCNYCKACTVSMKSHLYIQLLIIVTISCCYVQYAHSLEGLNDIHVIL